MVIGLVATVCATALRQALDVQLGFIAMTAALCLVLILELLGGRVKAPDFEEILSQLDWPAILVYIALSALVLPEIR